MKALRNMFIRKCIRLATLSAMAIMAISCLKDLPDSYPDRLEWNPEVAFPLGEDRFGLNSISGFDTTLLNIVDSTGLPDWVDELVLNLEGRMDFDLSSINENLEHLNRMLFRVNIYNGFPNQILAQAYFRNDAMDNIDSMFSEGPLPVPPGVAQGTGETVQPAYTREDATFSRERIEMIAQATGIFFRATLIVGEVDSTLIPFYPSYHFDVRIGAMLDLSMEF